MVSRRLQALVLSVLPIAALAAQQQTQPQPPPMFRSGTTVVPLDVRVVDRLNTADLIGSASVTVKATAPKKK